MHSNTILAVTRPLKRRYAIRLERGMDEKGGFVSFASLSGEITTIRRLFRQAANVRFAILKGLLMGDENGDLVIVNDVPCKTPFADIGKRGPAEGSGDEEHILLPADPGGKMVGGVEMEFCKVHAVEFKAGILLEAFELGDTRIVVLMDINDFSGKVDEAWKEIAELFDGVYAFPAAVIGHIEVLDGGEVLRDDEHGAFGIVQSLPQILIGLVVVGFSVKTFSADEDQICESAFPDEQVFVPFAVVAM
jgi:hypothetical protein